MKKWIGIILLICGLPLFNGCSEETPLSKRIIVQNVGVDRMEKGYHLSMNAFVADDSGEDVADITSTTFFSRTGATIADAIANLGLVTGRSPFFSHNEVVVLGEDTARQGISDVMGFFMEYPECRAGVDVFVAVGSADELIACKSADNTMVAKNFQELSQIGDSSGKAIHKTVFGVGAALSNPAMDFCLPCVRVEEEEDKDGEAIRRIVAGGTAVFREDRLAGYLDETETQGYLLLAGETSHLSLTVEVPGYGVITSEFRQITTDVHVDVQSGIPSVTVVVKAEGEPIEKLSLNGKALGNDFYEQLNEICSRQMESAMRRCVEKTAAFESDPYGFGALVWQKNPVYWEENGGSWRALLAQADFSFSVQTNLRQIHRSLQQ